MISSEFSGNWPLLGTVTAALAVFIVVIWIIQYGYYHPLTKFPGPRLAGISAIPFVYNKVIGNQHRWIMSLHNRYGPVVRYLPDTLSYIEPGAWADIFGPSNGGRGNLPKDIENKMPFIGGDNSIMRMNDADHSRVRRLLAPALSEKAIREQQEIIKSYIGMLIDHVKTVAQQNGSIDMMRWYNFTTFDVIGDLAFGESLGMLKEGQWTPWVYAINKSVPLSTSVAAASRHFPLIGVLLHLFLPSSLYKSLQTHSEWSKDQVEKRLGRETERTDFWKFILRKEERGAESLTPVENHALGMTLMVAGSETTAALLSGMTFYLLKNPDKLRRLASEIREACPSPDDVNVDNLSSLPYLFACLEEGLRLYPPTPLGQQRIVPPGGSEVCGRLVNPGTIVTISHWTAYRYPEFWHKAEEFHPERWLEANEKEGPFASDRRDVFYPFSHGPRNCVGKKLAYHEARLIVASLLRDFDLELCEESQDWDDQKVFGLARRGPLMVKPTPVPARTD